MNSNTVLLFAAILAIGFQAGVAIECFECISGVGPAGEFCGDPFDKDVARSNGLLKNCDALESDVGAAEKRNYTMCRKFLQDVEGEFRVVRGCATKGRPGKCIDRTGTAKIKLQYCECENSDPNNPCNFALKTVASSCVFGVVAIFCTLFSAKFMH
jgi:hypothetical protein